jgi:predicted nucleic acid-binding protein
MSSYLVDTNVLLRSVQKTHAMHMAAFSAVRTLLGRGEDLSITPQNLIEFWAVATRPLSSNGLALTISRTAQEMSKLKGLFKLRADTLAIFLEWERLVIQYQVIGKPTHDARLVAAMKAHGLTHLLTFNVGDFRRFGNIIVVDPSTVV